MHSQANAIGRNDTSLREYLEKHYTDGLDEEKAIKLTVRTLLEVRIAREKWAAFGFVGHCLSQSCYCKFEHVFSHLTREVLPQRNFRLILNF